jgi:hypothetical protein
MDALSQSIRRAVRSKRTGLYLKENGGWTEEMEAAAPWDSVTEAMSLCSRYKVDDVEMVLRFRHPRYDMAIELAAPR